jgi:Macrocin-O-methyltransferase (TylF)
MIGNRRMSNQRQITEYVIAKNIPGDLIETGVWRGGARIMVRAIMKAYGVTDRRVGVADWFCGLPAPNPKYEADANDQHHSFPELAVSLEEVKSNFSMYDLLE